MSPAGLEVVASQLAWLTPAVLTQPAVARTRARLRELRGSDLAEALELDPPAAVVDELLAGVPDALLVDLAELACTPRLVRELTRSAASGYVLARWTLLPLVSGSDLPGLVRSLVPGALASDPSRAWEWLAAATRCPDLLAQLVDVVPKWVAPAVARFAAAAAGGQDPSSVFAAEAVAVLTMEARPDWVPEPAAAGLRFQRPSWRQLVAWTGLEQVAVAAVSHCGGDPSVLAQVAASPLLVGTPVQDQVRVVLGARVGAGGAPADVVAQRAVLLAPGVEGRVCDWVARGHDGASELDFAWSALQQSAARRRGCRRGYGSAIVDKGALLGAVALVCADVPGGRVGTAALEWVAATRPGVEMVDQDNELMDQLVGVAASLHSGAGLGTLPVPDLALVREQLRHPRWLARRLGAYFTGVPGVPDVAFVTALLDLAGQFTGSLDDLVATAAGVVV